MTKNTFVEAEIGRIPCLVFGTLASSLQPKEYIYSHSVEDLIYQVCINTSYRKSASLLNRILHRPQERQFKTNSLAYHVDSAGRRIGEEMHALAQEILIENPGMSETGIVEEPGNIPDSVTAPWEERGHDGLEDRKVVIQEAIDNFNEGRDACDRIKDTGLIKDIEMDPDKCVYVSIDDVGVRHQKDTRKDGGSKNGKIIENTVIHIQSREGEYTITDVGMEKAFRLLVAYLLSNNLLENRYLYLFSDGATNIMRNIELFFGNLCPYRLILDWYHLEKRMNELCSMALKGTKDERHELRYSLDRKLWAGNCDEAIMFLKKIDPKYIKNESKLEDAVAYLGRKKPFIACYALRKILGYRNSSNPAEKANDLVVATRQKHNGMSWSYEGSGSLATITMLSQNDKTGLWIRDRRVSFEPVPVKCQSAVA